MEDIETDSMLIACLDGHGANGHKISEYFKSEIESRLFKHPCFTKAVNVAISEVLIRAEYDLYQKETRLADYSGTTISLAVVRGSKITIANIGDSRIVLAQRNDRQKSTNSVGSTSSEESDTDHNAGAPNGTCNCESPVTKRPRLEARDMTIDHKPDNPHEYARICSAGGRVFSVRYADGQIGPARVWLGHMNVPGLAMSRSLGDFVVHTAGVTSKPDIFEYELDPNEDCMLIVATDGIWDFIPSQDAVNIAGYYAHEPGMAVEALLQESHFRWLQHEQIVDDSTVCVMHLIGLDKLESTVAVDDSH